MAFFDIRRVRVRPEFAHLYPEVAPDVWLSARRVTRLVRRRRGPRILFPGHRVLSELHFEFRGGARGRQYLTGAWLERVTI
ncbi:MAG TPA: hypothetical protein VEB59_00450 [Gemmatimonadales bacterium]|nr:hypothetical protein [Gemmatimonadales bacterium]